AKVLHAIRTPAGFDPASVPVVDGTFAAVIDDTGTVTAADLTTGRILWQHALGEPALNPRPAVSGDAVVASTLFGPAEVLARDDGRDLDNPVSHDQRGVPVAYAVDGTNVVVTTRLAAEPAVAAWPVP